MLTLQAVFGTIFNILKREDRYLLKYTGPKEPNECGVSNLEEKHIQYILYRNLLKLGGFSVYMEDPYNKGKRKCDLTIYPKNKNIGIWIEIKTTGWCWDGAFKKWVISDLRKMKPLQQRRKYLLVSSLEDKKPAKSEWNDYFKREIRGVKFDPEFFRFFRTKFIDDRISRDGYYTLCLLKVI